MKSLILLISLITSSGALAQESKKKRIVKVDYTRSVATASRGYLSKKIIKIELEPLKVKGERPR